MKIILAGLVMVICLPAQTNDASVKVANAAATIFHEGMIAGLEILSVSLAEQPQDKPMSIATFRELVSEAEKVVRKEEAK